VAVVMAGVALPQEEALPQEAPMVAGTQAVVAVVVGPGGQSVVAEILAAMALQPRVVRWQEVELPEGVAAAVAEGWQLAEERRAPWPPPWAVVWAIAQGGSRTRRGRRT
jgi:hypothetical protein